MKINQAKNIPRYDKQNKLILCDGFRIEISEKESDEILADLFFIAVGFEILKLDIHEAQQFAMDYVECELKKGAKNL